jgi:hypothetical protein
MGSFDDALASGDVPAFHLPGEYDGAYYHYSLLRTLEDGFGIDEYVGHAADVDPIAAIWRSYLRHGSPGVQT